MKRTLIGTAALLAAAHASAQSPGPGAVAPPPRPGAMGSAPPPDAVLAPPRSVAASGPADLSLQAVFSDGRPIRAGIVWRIYAERGGDQPPELVARHTAPQPAATLPSGPYLVHAAYGLASASRRITLQPGRQAERLEFSAGALRLGGAIGDVPIPPNRLNFNIFLPLANDSEGRLVAANIKAGDLVRLPAGQYHVVSTYGESNAIMRSDLKVETGVTTEATLNHRAATVTLKLVASAGGEAFAGTAFSVLTPGGDVIREAIGAFPVVTLAEGDYVLIARHDGKVYTREFKVESGLDRDIEVQTTS